MVDSTINYRRIQPIPGEGAPLGSSFVPCGCQYDPAFSWLCINTEYQSETLVVRELWPLGLVAWLPQFRAASRIKPLFPTYVFCRANLADATWHRIYRTRGVVTILGTRYERPVPMPEAAMQALWARAGIDGLLSDQPGTPGQADLLPGTDVAFGPGAMLSGICEKTSAERVTILFQLFGRDVRATVARAAVAPAR